MRYLLLFIFIFTSAQSYSQNTLAEQQNADSALAKVYHKLKDLKAIRYVLTRELNYPSENYHNASKWVCYYDFLLSTKPTSFKYQIEDSTSKSVFNGTEKFELNKSAKTIQIAVNPSKKTFQRLSFLYNSIITLRNVLPLVITDKNSTKTISDTFFHNHSYEIITVNIGKRRIRNLGQGFDIMQTKYNFIYKIIVDKESQLPIEILQKNDLNNDFIKTSFTDININPPRPSETSWYYSSYTKEYKLAGHKDIPEPLPTGSIAPDWKLKVYNTNKELSLSNVKGKVVLLDFWIKNCGPCILSVPHLNKLYDKFKNENFELLSINSYDSKEEIEGFINRHEINYPILLHGNTVAKEYGVSGFPTLFIVDKSGKVVYSQTGFNESTISEIEGIIKKAL